MQNRNKGRFAKDSPLPIWLAIVLLVAALGIIALVLGIVLSSCQTEPPNEDPGLSQPPGQFESLPPSSSEPEDSTDRTDPSVSPGSEPEESTEPSETQKPTTPPTTQKPPVYTKPTEPKPEVEVEAVQITCDRFSLFNGQFPEDGRDELVANVASILVTNKSDRFLDLATISFNIDGRSATFIVTGLPAGRSAWVLESNRLTAFNDSKFTYLDMVTGFRDNAIAKTDKITISATGNMLMATNNTDQPIKDVFVIYKIRHTDGNFLGGIAYRTDFGTLEPGASAEVLAGHWSGDAEIVRIGWLTE